MNEHCQAVNNTCTSVMVVSLSTHLYLTYHLARNFDGETFGENASRPLTRKFLQFCFHRTNVQHSDHIPTSWLQRPTHKPGSLKQKHKVKKQVGAQMDCCRRQETDLSNRRSQRCWSQLWLLKCRYRNKAVNSTRQQSIDKPFQLPNEY